MRWLKFLFIEHRSTIAVLVGMSLFLATLVFRYLHGTWWTLGKVLAVIAVVVALFHLVDGDGGEPGE